MRKKHIKTEEGTEKKHRRRTEKEVKYDRKKTWTLKKKREKLSRAHPVKFCTHSDLQSIEKSGLAIFTCSC